VAWPGTELAAVMQQQQQQGGILVTGLPRTGTSWVGKMLEASGQVVYVNEPLNPSHPPGRSPGVLNADVSHRFQYICTENEEPWERAFADTLSLHYRPLAEIRRNHAPYDLARLLKYGSEFTAGRLRGRVALIDDPFAVLSSAWFAQRLGCKVVVCVRHPLGFVGSWQRLGWSAALDDLLDQPLLIRDLLHPYVEEMRILAGSADRLAGVTLLWRMAYTVLADLAGRLPLLVRPLRYEDLAADPITGFRELYDFCGLTWTGKVHRRVVSASTGNVGAERPHTWSLRGGLSRTAFRPMDSRGALSSYRGRLTQHDIDRVHKLTADVVTRYYDDSASGSPAEHDGRRASEQL
jgi:Sulfotransferase domain